MQGIPERVPVGLAFEEVSEKCGVRFQFHTGTRNQHDLVEIMGGGVGLVDFDADGWIDIYLCNGGPIGRGSQPVDPTSRLFRNNRDGTFLDITDKAGAPGPSYAMGVAVGDADGDGREDLFVTGWRDQRLYHNNGDGTFKDMTKESGLESTSWSTSAAFADLDDDGDLDLYVASYVDFDPDGAPFCAAPDGKRDYCGPEDFPAQPHTLYRNDGGGKFSDASHESGIAKAKGGRGLGVLIADLSGDRLPDIYVSNDGSPCRLFQNEGNLRFEEVGSAQGVAIDGNGEMLAGMGIGYGDLDGDLHPDLAVANFYDRSTIAFVQVKPGLYTDGSAALGLTAATRSVLGFGLVLADWDGDGDIDLLQANGHVLDRARLGVPFAMKPTLLRNDGPKRHLVNVAARAGPWFDKSMLGRGVAVGDLDHDGKPDAVVGALNSPAAVLRNITSGAKQARIELVAKRFNMRRPIGARIKASIGRQTVHRQTYAGGSYLSASDPATMVPVDQRGRIDRIEVDWPSGRIESWDNPIPKKGTVLLVEGTGKVSPDHP